MENLIHSLLKTIQFFLRGLGVAEKRMLLQTIFSVAGINQRITSQWQRIRFCIFWYFRSCYL